MAPMQSLLSCLPTFTNEAVVKPSLHQLDSYRVRYLGLMSWNVPVCTVPVRFFGILRLSRVCPQMYRPLPWRLLIQPGGAIKRCALCSEGTAHHSGAAVVGVRAHRSGTHHPWDLSSKEQRIPEKTHVYGTQGTLRHSIVQLQNVASRNVNSLNVTVTKRSCTQRRSYTTEELQNVSIT
jgi:hypothetical protein